MGHYYCKVIDPNNRKQPFLIKKLTPYCGNFVTGYRPTINPHHMFNYFVSNK